MPTIKNVEFDIVMHTYQRNSKNTNEIDHFETTTTRTYFDLFIELAGKLDPKTGLGNRDEQLLRMDLENKFKAAIAEKKDKVTIDEAPAAFLKRHIVNLNPLVLCRGFIDFQGLILSWK